MKTRRYIIPVLVLLILKTNAYSHQFSQGVKFGLNYSKFREEKYGASIPTGDYPKINYSQGYSAGVFNETVISDKFSVINEICVRKNMLTRTIYTGPEDILDEEIELNYLSLPILLKVDLNKMGLPYFLLGLDIGFVLKAKYKYFSNIYNDHGDFEISDKFSLFGTGLNLGIGKKFKIIKFYLLCEANYIFSMTNYKFEKFSPYLTGTWQYNQFQLTVGLQFN